MLPLLQKLKLLPGQNLLDKLDLDYGDSKTINLYLKVSSYHNHNFLTASNAG